MSRVLIGILLTCIVWIISACGILFAGWSLPSTNPINVDDGSGLLNILAAICAIIFSFVYFWRLRQQSRSILRIHLLLTLLLLSYFGIHLALTRHEQNQVLTKYQEFRQAVLNEDYQGAYELMTPDWRKEHSVSDMDWETDDFLAIGPEDSIYSVHVSVYSGYAFIVPSPDTSFWHRASAGRLRSFEKVGSEWFVRPRNIDFYLANP